MSKRGQHAGTRDPEAGVTLVEMLVAVAIGALVGIAGFTMLDTVLRTERRAGRALDASAALDRAFRVIGRDVLAAEAGALRLGSGVLTLPDGTRYAVEDGLLVRRVGGVSSAGARGDVVQTLADGIEGLSWQALGEDGRWRGAGSEDDAPRALRLCLDLPQGALCRLFPTTPGVS